MVNENPLKNLCFRRVNGMSSGNGKIDHEVCFYFSYPLHLRLQYSKYTVREIFSYMNTVNDDILKAETSIAENDRERLHTNLLFIESNLVPIVERIVLLGSAFPCGKWNVTRKQLQLIREETSHEK